MSGKKASLGLGQWGFYMSAAVIAASAVGRCYDLWDVPQRYVELIVGHLAWDFSGKFHDYLILVSLFSVFMGTLFVFIRLSDYLTRKFGQEALICFHNLQVLFCIPAGMFLSGLMLSMNYSFAFLHLSTVLLLTGLLFLVLLLQKKENFWEGASDRLFLVLYLIIFAVLLTGFAIVAPLVVANRIGALLHSKILMTDSLAFSVILTSICIVSSAVAVFCINSQSCSRFELRLRQFILILQFFIPAFFLILIPAPFVVEGKMIFHCSLSPAAWGLLAFLILAAWIALIQKYRTLKSRRQGNWLKELTTWTALAVLFFVKSGTGNPPFIPSDDYHFGELLVPWWSFIDGHMIPFCDYVPARGLVNYFAGFINWLFIDGSAAGFSSVDPFVCILVLSIAFVVFRETLGTGIAFLALLLMPFFKGYSEIDIMVTVFICFVCRLFLVSRPHTWVVSWFLCAMALFLFAPAQGFAAFLATTPLCLVMLWRLVVERVHSSFVVELSLLLLTVLAVLATPLGSMIAGAMRYLIEQSAVNSIAHGIEWRESFLSSKTNNPLLIEMVRASWLVVACWAGVSILNVRSVQNRAGRWRTLTYAVPVMILLVLAIFRSAGRIDWEGEGWSWSRLGLTSIWAIATLLPFLMFTSRKRTFQSGRIFVWFFLGGMIFNLKTVGLPSYTFEPSRMARSLYDSVQKRGVDMPWLGSAIMDRPHWERITGILTFLDKALDPQETYLDLTGRQAHYYYFRRKPPIEIGSVYNLVSESQQLRALALLRRDPPPVVLIRADNIVHDGGTVSLRSYLLYRYVVLALDYKVLQVGGNVFLVREDRLARVSDMDIKWFEDISGSPESTLNGVFQPGHLKDIPASWGRSWASLHNKLVEVKMLEEGATVQTNDVVRDEDGFYQRIGGTPYVRFEMSDMNMSGRDAGVLSFDYSCQDIGPEAELEIAWATADNGEQGGMAMRLHARNGRLLVPMDSSPAWLLAKKIVSLKFSPVGKDVCASFSVRNVKLFQRDSVLKSDLFL